MTQSFEVEKKENEHFDDLFSNIYYSEDTHDYVSLLWESDYVWEYLNRSIEYSDYQSCSMNYSNWIESFTFLGKERTSLREKIKFLLNYYEDAINKLFKCCNGSYTAKKEFETSTKEWFMNIKYRDAELNKYIFYPLSCLWLCVDSSIYIDDSSCRLCKLLCISRIFLNQDKENQFRFVCSLAETVMKYQSEEMLLRTIEYYLKIQLLMNPLCTFDDLSTGISDLQFEHQLRFCYSKRMLCKSQTNATDQSIEENLKDFKSSFDEVKENTALDYRAKLNIFNSLIHILNKFIEQDHAANIKLTIEVLQKIIKNFFIVYCFKIFSKDSVFRNWRSSKTNGQHLFDFISLTSPKENLLRDVFCYIMKFQHNLKLIPKNLQTEMMVATIIEENKCMCSCLLKTLRYMPSSRPFETVNEFSNELTFSYLHMHYRTKKILPIFIDTIVDYSAVKGFVNVIKEFCDMRVTASDHTEIILECICDIANIRFHKKPHELAKVILDINLTQSEGDLLIKITHTLWDLLKIREKRKSQNNIKTHQNKKGSKLQQILAEGDRPFFFKSKENEQKRRDIDNENMREIKPILYRCLCILRNAKKKEQITDVNISNYINGFNFDEQSLQNEDRAGKKSNTEIMLILMFLLLVAATRHHKSAKLKKYLSLKYEYKEAILYILWCSGDIDINPGPPMKKSQLIHDSQRERAWIQNISSILLKLYKGKPPSSKPNNLWTEKPEHWPTNKPFYDTKNHPYDEHKCFISDTDLLKCLIHCCDCKKVKVSSMYKKEITAWTKNKSQLLHKLHTFRTETEKIRTVLQNLLTYKDTDELQEALDNINVKLSLKVGDSDPKNDPRKRLKNQSEMIADITRYLAAVVCKIIKGKDPESKWDGIWTAPPEQWPTNVPFFSPFNRGKCKYTCSDQLLLSTLLQHPKAVIPPKYKSLVEAFQTVVNVTDNKKEAKKHKEVLCRVKTIQTDVSVLDYALTYLHSEGFFTTEVCHPLHQWWSSQNVENQIEITFANLHRISEERPTIFIAVTRECMKLSIMQSTMDYMNKSKVCYNISFDESIPTKLDSYSQNCSDVDQLCTDDNLQGACVIKNLQIPHEQKSCSNAASLNKSNHGKDTTHYSFINNDNETDFSTMNDTLFSRHKLLPVESNILQLSELEKSKENATSNTVSISNREETLARDSGQTNCTTDVSGINTHHTGQCDNNQRAIVPETNESQVFIEKQSKGKKRKFANESTDNGMSKTMLMESDTIKDCLHKLTGEETVSDNQFDIDFLLENCIHDITFQHKSTTETSKIESSFGSAEDELPVSSDNDEVDDGLEIFLTDFINYESGKRSRLENELLLDSS